MRRLQCGLGRLEPEIESWVFSLIYDLYLTRYKTFIMTVLTPFPRDEYKKDEVKKKRKKSKSVRRYHLSHLEYSFIPFSFAWCITDSSSFMSSPSILPPQLLPQYAQESLLPPPSSYPPLRFMYPHSRQDTRRTRPRCSRSAHKYISFLTF